MASISSFQPGVVLHSKRRLDQSILSAIREAYPEGVDTPGLKNCLQESFYNPVLCAVWGERDLNRRVDWLRANADLHAPLIFELAIAEFEIEPTIEKVIHVSVPLISTASLRVQQDACCLEGYSDEMDFYEAISRIYLEVLAHKVKEYHPSVDLNKLIQDQQNLILNFTRQRFFNIEMRTQRGPETLPSPLWISYDLQGKQQRMKPPQAFASTRQNFIDPA